MLVLGHRGVRGALPENTLASLLAARDLGAGGVEFDVRLSRDGVPVLHHDPTLDRLCGLPDRVADRTWSELRSLTGAGSAPLAGLAEVLDRLPADQFLDVEIKDPAAAPAVAHLLADRGRIERTAVSCFEHPVLASSELRACGVPRWLNAVAASASVFEWAVQTGAAALIVPVGQVTAGTVARAAAAGLQLGCWGFGDAAALDRLRELGCAVAIPDLPLQGAAGQPRPGRPDRRSGEIWDQ